MSTKELAKIAMTVLYGESNVGKTFVALKLAYCIATGKPFQNRQVEQGAVVYVACESSRSVLDRVVGLKEYYKLSDFDLAVVPCPIDLLSPKNDVDNLIDLIEDVSAEVGNVKLIVIDTLSRAISGGNENSPDDMGAFVKYIDKIRHSMKAHMMVVHHAGKDTAKGARGHSLLRGATDTELEVRLVGPSNVIRVRKQRDMDAGNDIRFELNVIEIGVNQYGKTITTCVMQELNVPAAEDFDDLPDLTDREQIFMEVLEANEDDNNTIGLKELRPLLEASIGFFQGKSHHAFCNAVMRTVTKLVTKGEIKFNTRKQLVTRCVTTGTDDVTIH